jgi:GTPase Era involved in 16S rRNA processing
MEQKIYVAYDGTNDYETYKQIQEWVDSNGEQFNFFDAIDLYKKLDKVEDELLKSQVRERMSTADVVVLVVAKTTKSFRRFIRWQIEYAINNNIPIIAMNVNGIRSVDYDRIPTILKKNLAMHIAFQGPILEYALNNWPESFKVHLSKELKNSFKYTEDIYNDLGLIPSDV